jgi:hypothetical protein
MSHIRPLLLSTFGGLALLLAGALSPRPADAPAAISDPAAESVLDNAITALSPERLHWLRMGLWQQGNLASLSYQAEGTFLAGPDHRLRLDLHVRAGNTTNRLQVVSDGRKLWQVEQTGAAAPSVSWVNMGPVLEILERRDTPVERREAFYRYQLFAGPGPLLESLRPGTTFTRRETVRWRDRDIVLLTGVRALPPREKNWPDFLPRHCRLFLDAHTLWPHRLEWWGRGPEQQKDSVLLQVEFRDPVCNETVPEQAFTYRPGNGDVKDLTKIWLNGVRNGFTGLELP